MPQCRPQRSTQGLAKAAPGAVTPLLHCNSTWDCSMNIKVLTKRQMGENCSCHWNSHSLGLVATRAAPEVVGKGDQRLINTAGCALKSHRVEEQRKECHQGDKRFMSSAQAAEQCTLATSAEPELCVQSRWKFLPVPGQQHTSPQQLQQKATCYRTGSSQCFIF